MNALLLALGLCVSASAEPTLTVQSRAVQRGEILLVAVEGEGGKKAPSADFSGRALEFFPAASTGTWLAFIGLDLDAPAGPATLRATLHDASGRVIKKTETLDVSPGKFPVQTLQVEQKFVTPAKSDAERAEGEAVKVHELYTHGEEKRLFDGSFAAPILGAATARFGERRVFNGQPRSPHSGMDLKAKKGTPVRSPAAGKVVLAGPLYFSGNTIILDHGLGITTLYAHLSRMLVKRGDLVKKGQLIGKVGATGRVTGPHLHWALKFHEARVDPYSLVSLDLDAFLKPRAADPLKRSAACDRTDLPPAPWGKTAQGLRARVRPLQAGYAPGAPLTFLVEIQNVGKKSAFLDFVRDANARAAVLGFNRAPEPFSSLASSATARLATEQVKIAPKRALCFEQDRDAGGPLLARATTSYSLTYDTAFLYASTATARSGIWRGKLSSRPADVVVSTTVP